ncbi:alkyl sulfatase dimerization domain-containing protein [Leptospira saintgironsiae]|uniref:MBL fold metallo-hydrolase n=1 Tax=Leptospira saintgironsiae TaxID=2023183 RepID=A0A2M9YEB0_9LEPT|nr:alkyl sulfatase dimerization domain-containing protein [Leptospira saintgironsiae]PJZ49756.1 MBL fold metallo-hydrolase [Leptospira saintgironsiae]
MSRNIIRSILFFLLFITGFHCTGPVLKTEAKISDPKLSEFNKEFEKKIYEVTPGIYSAVGYGIANSILIIGKDGLIIVDTMDDRKAGEEVFSEFRKISSLPVKAIVYTHSHPDHIFGSGAFAKDSNPEIYAHESLRSNVERLASETAPIISQRSARMFGNFLKAEELINAGIGPFLGYTEESRADYIPPTKTFKDRLSINVAGVSLELIHAPGETDDQIYVLVPGKKTILTGDNFYKAFPNLYTIRGTWFRNLKNWYRSLDIIREIGPEFLVPSHGRPLAGVKIIYETVTDYRDAIQFVHDQSLRGMNGGLNPEDLVEYVKLPSHLAKSPYLQEIYGKVSWSVRSSFNGNLGWFSGDPADLHPLTKEKSAELIANLAGGADSLLKFSKEYYAKGKYQEALQLTGHILRLDPKNKEAIEIRISSLDRLGEKEENANARHYYLTEALEVREKFVARLPIKPSAELLKKYSVYVILSSFVANLDPKASADLDQKVGLQFTDTGEEYTIHIRRGVAELKQRMDKDLDIQVQLDSLEWKKLLSKTKTPLTVLPEFSYKKGNLIQFVKFLKNFSPLEPKLLFEKP